MIMKSLLKPASCYRFYYIDDIEFDLYYEILLTCNKDTQLCRKLISLHRI